MSFLRRFPFSAAVLVLVLACGVSPGSAQSFGQETPSDAGEQSAPAPPSPTPRQASPQKSSEAPEPQKDGDAYDDLLRDLGLSNSGTETAVNGGAKTEDSDKDAPFVLVCEGEFLATGQILQFPPRPFEFTIELDLANETFEVLEIEQGEFFEEGENYDVLKTTRRFALLEADYDNHMIDIDELKLDLRDYELSAEPKMAGGYQPKLIQPTLELEGSCEPE